MGLRICIFFTSHLYCLILSLWCGVVWCGVHAIDTILSHFMLHFHPTMLSSLSFKGRTVKILSRSNTHTHTHTPPQWIHPFQVEEGRVVVVGVGKEVRGFKGYPFTAKYPRLKRLVVSGRGSWTLSRCLEVKVPQVTRRTTPCTTTSFIFTTRTWRRNTSTLNT